MDQFIEWLSRPFWQGVGSIASLISLLLFIWIERQRIFSGISGKPINWKPISCMTQSIIIGMLPLVLITILALAIEFIASLLGRNTLGWIIICTIMMILGITTKSFLEFIANLHDDLTKVQSILYSIIISLSGLWGMYIFFTQLLPIIESYFPGNRI